jgi:phage-related minor tail protein
MKEDYMQVNLRDLVNIRKIMDNIRENIGHLSAETLGWVSVILIHLATIPTLVAGLTEKLPPVDIVVLMWLGLFMFFVRSVIAKDLLNIITIGFGFFVQAVLLALIVFK